MAHFVRSSRFIRVVLALAAIAGFSDRLSAQVAKAPSGSATSVIADDASKTQLANVLKGGSPAGLEELKALQSRIKDLTETILSCTVAVQVGRANGSGVIVTEDGYVLTAAHVAGVPNRNATILLPDGSTARGVTLGMNQSLDAGLIKIDGEQDWPHAPLGRSADVKPGQWCLATGHPGGFDSQRLPVLRFGRVLKVDESAILTDCTLVGGDSGGPLFDLNGQVIAIHSRIGKNLTINVHVPVDPFRDSWSRLARGEVWGLIDESAGGWLGVTEDVQASNARIDQVTADSPAAEAGLRPGDVVIAIEDEKIESFRDLQQAVRSYAAGAEIMIEIERESQIRRLKVTLGQRP